MEKATQYRILQHTYQQSKKLLEQIEHLNRDSNTILFTRLSENDVCIITVNCLLNFRKQVGKLCFELYGIGNKRYGYLEIEADYYDLGTAKDTLLKQLRINDIVFGKQYCGQGYGSLLMAEALHYVAHLFGENVTIVGYLSSVDEADDDNRLRRDHFYKKFGFNVQNERIVLNGIPLEMVKDDTNK